MAEPNIDVFISAASEDYEWATEVYRCLEESGLRCFFSDLSIDQI